MKQLVYYSVSNHVGYLQMMKYSMMTLRQKGEYEGDIILFTNIKDIPSSIQNECIVKYVPGRCSPKNFKYESREEIDFTEYDKVLYFDADILFSSPVCHIFDMIEGNNFVHVRDTIRNMVASCYLGFQEEVASKVPWSNSGFYGTSGVIADAFCKKWKQAMICRNEHPWTTITKSNYFLGSHLDEKKTAFSRGELHFYNDQPAFNYLVIDQFGKGNINLVQLPESWARFLGGHHGHGMPEPGVVFSHYLDKKKLKTHYLKLMEISSLKFI